MVNLETATCREGDVTLVECRLESDACRRVRVVNRLAGPVWPPRRRGVPAAGWDGDGVAVTVDGRAGVGYATPAPPADPPAAVVSVEEPDDGTGFEPAVDVTATPAGVVRELSDPRPPRDAVPTDVSPDRGRTQSDAADGAPSFDEWFADVERRVARLEGVAAATTLPEATVAVAAAGGLDGVESLAATVADDAETLVRLADRAETLAGRATAVEPDLATLRRLA